MTTKVLSTLVLASCVLVGGSVSGQSERTVSLQGRVDALAQQVHLRYRFHQPTLDAQRERIQRVLADWNEIQQSEVGDNRERMENWLDLALQAVMPGGKGLIPPAPVFEEAVVVSRNTPALAAPPLPSETSRSVIESTPQKALLADSESTEAVEELPAPSVPQPAVSQVVEADTPRKRSVAKPVVDPLPKPAQQPRASSRSKWSRHPAAAPLEWRDPFADDPAASPNPLRSGTRHEARRPVLSSNRGVRVDRRQLNAEVRGYNQALRELQHRVMQLDSGDVFGLADAAEELEQLELRRQFLDLYREGLSSADRGTLPDSPSSELVRELVRRKADEIARKDPPKRRAERRALERLNDRLAGLDDGRSSSNR